MLPIKIALNLSYITIALICILTNIQSNKVTPIQYLICENCSGESCTNIAQLRNILEKEDSCNDPDFACIEADSNDFEDEEVDENVENVPGPSSKRQKIN